MSTTTQDRVAAKPATYRPRKMAREPKSEALGHTTAPARTNRVHKIDLILDLLTRPEGATIDQLIAATGWLPHTTRAALTGLKKKGHMVVSEKVEGLRRYHVSSGAA
jgi:hypothetical protein